jgi:oligopeptidase B
MIKQPKAEKKPHVLSIHGDDRIDNYFWLNQREDPSVIAYLNAENAYREAMTKHTKPLQDVLYTEMVGRIAQTDMSVPFRHKGYWYITRFEEGQQYPIHSRKKETLEAAEEILLNVNELAQGHAYFSIGGRAVSPNNQWLAYGVDTVSRRIYSLKFKNLATNETLDYSIEGTTGSAVWAADNQTLFYTIKDSETLRSCKIMRHVLGSNPADDVCVFTEEDDTFGVGVGKTRSEEYLVIGSGSTVSNEYRFLAANNPTGEWSVFEPRERHHEYSIDHADGTFYILTNWNAKNFKLMALAAKNGQDVIARHEATEELVPPSRESIFDRKNWIDVIPHREDVLLEGMTIFKDSLVLSERINGLTQIRVIQNLGKEAETDHYINFGEEVFMAYTGTNPDFDTNTLRLGFTSMATPNTVYDYDMTARTFNLLKQEAVLDVTFDPVNYVTKRVYATAADGVKVPISVVYRRNLFRKRANPLLLYGYGSYGHSMDPYFSSARLSLLDRGFVFAIAHIRGGQELGRHWYEDGKLMKKMNTFTDFIACAETLITEGLGAKRKIMAMGGSAGGLLMGAVMNMRPDLWCGVVAQVPFVDVVTTMLDETIPLTTGEFDEWGNPKDIAAYEMMKSYSPYDQVSAQKYPPTLITTGLHDSQVQYFEPAKWIAKLRDMRTSDKNPLYMYCNMDTGHGGASGRFERYKEVAMEYAFLLDLVEVI